MQSNKATQEKLREVRLNQSAREAFEPEQLSWSSQPEIRKNKKGRAHSYSAASLSGWEHSRLRLDCREARSFRTTRLATEAASLGDNTYIRPIKDFTHRSFHCVKSQNLQGESPWQSHSQAHRFLFWLKFHWIYPPKMCSHFKITCFQSYSKQHYQIKKIKQPIVQHGAGNITIANWKN